MELDFAKGGAEFTLYAKHIALGQGRFSDAIRSAEDDPRTPARVIRILKAAVAVGTTADATWASALVDHRVVASGFLESLRNMSAFDQMLPSMRTVPLRTRIIAATASVLGSAVAEGAPKPITRMTLAGPTLDARKAAAIVVVSRELLKSAEPGADAFLAAELRGAVAGATDEAFIPGLIGGATAFASSGGTVSAILTDLGLLLRAVKTSANSRLFLIVDSDTAKSWATLFTSAGQAFPEMTPTGGAVAGVQVVVSDANPSNTSGSNVILVDAAQVVASSDTITVDSAEHATLNLDDAPTEPGAETVMTSLFQSNLTAVRAERYFGFEVIGTSAIAILTGV